jgi:hypothetical protein
MKDLILACVMALGMSSVAMADNTGGGCVGRLIALSPPHALNQDGTIGTDDFDASVLKIGEEEDNLSLYDADNIDKSGVPQNYSQPGGFVFPVYDIQLMNCHIAVDNGNLVLALDDTAENSTDQLEQQLESELGFLDSADQGNAAVAIIKQPDSDCAKYAEEGIDFEKQNPNQTIPDSIMSKFNGDNDVCQPPNLKFGS